MEGGLWLLYQYAGGWKTHYAQVDALVQFSPSHCAIVECKFKHTPAAYWQMERYRALVQHWRPGCQLSLIEVCRWFDPKTPWPEKVILLSKVAEAKPGKVYVKFWNPMRGLP